MGVNLVLNHITVIMNVFGPEAGLKMLEYKIDIRDWAILKPFLIYVRAITATQYTDIPMDEVVANELRNI